MSPTHYYYQIRPVVPRRVQIALRRKLVRAQLPQHTHRWPIERSSSLPPAHWRGWPEDKQCAVVLTHDVETALGQDRCGLLAALEKERGFCSSFNFVPERYPVSAQLRVKLVEEGFEVGVHGLNHDGKLFSTKEVFSRRARKINGYLFFFSYNAR